MLLCRGVTIITTISFPIRSMEWDGQIGEALRGWAPLVKPGVILKKHSQCAMWWPNRHLWAKNIISHIKYKQRTKTNAHYYGLAVRLRLNASNLTRLTVWQLLKATPLTFKTTKLFTAYWVSIWKIDRYRTL